ncbi:AM-toxin synthetase [Aspergillus udagawae]|uniref:NRPS-like protein biosynthetic cluster n=1 Tax=Aspergillus udagawae TaxID=91492 RepID=A0A8E0R1M4_9EURO|nr:putative NRPS-like protein biosynthetic cluster [Aspergillus udagawae]GIC94507.1 putative NRPS-like protein biosynthetic cluster [Aspergillus udagawae]
MAPSATIDADLQWERWTPNCHPRLQKTRQSVAQRDPQRVSRTGCRFPKFYFRHHRLVPIGAVGELLLEEPMVGPGYLTNAVGTEKVFLSDPAFVTEARGPRGGNRRVYRSGDLMRYNLDGSLVYIGRKGSQVKLHGQRIELGEVETHVQSVLGSELSVIVELVTPNEDPDNMVLVAFVHLVKEEGVHEEPLETENSPLIASPTADLQSQVADAIVKLHDWIPRFMIPSLFLRLTRLPRIMTGKIRKTDLDQFRISHVVNKKASERAHGIDSAVPLCTGSASGPAEIGLDDDFFPSGQRLNQCHAPGAAARAQGLALAVSDILKSRRLSTLASHITIQPLGLKMILITPASHHFLL